ncbi:ATP-dependent Clp protease proteolytic subunit 4, chloroplastic [Tetrabaena socialis]|uniref:ATP-dependent Clp protease proteolytic subunit n=1 Tax=Tetrabaena socialis TaxID=47790 RepID=A0A2J8AAR2_9CHLO|nr:ATP-dependent Clp protease proteolytic subunit 4, chloroplastic [Tetrabaena socialis]|eukprot:PNH09610.1 ATP-dependent Clp protease proteolytic subunit 4, chloroplastic [Tetrabaena socialis]
MGAVVLGFQQHDNFSPLLITRAMAASLGCLQGKCPLVGKPPSRRGAGRVRAALWTPDQRLEAPKPKGWDRPWIQANGQPMVAPRTAEMQGDPFGLLLRQRVVFLGGEVEDFGADAIISQLLLLDSQDPTKDIKMFINSPGGSVTAGMGIYDAMMLCRSDVQTYCFGLAASMGAFLLGAGKRGKRYSMPNSRIMIHQPLGGASGQAVDIEIQVKEEFVTDRDDLVNRNIMDGDPFLAETPSWRFKQPQTEPYMPSQAPGSPWFRVKKVSKEQYKEMLEAQSEEQEALPDGKKSVKERLDDQLL